jgi:RNA polymerase sigma-70 factor, ECF subfamily
MMRTRNQSRRVNTTPLVVAPRTDDELVQAAQSGDHEAFAELCRRHAQHVRRRILGIVRHQDDAEDAMQETLLRAYLNLGRFRRACKFSTWMTAIGINAALTVIRKRKSRRESDIEPSSPNEPAWDVADQAPDPERRVAKSQIILLLRKELLGLPLNMQEAVASYYEHDHSLQEAADALGISVGAIKSRLLRGRRSLRSSFERKGLLDSHVQ